MTGAAVNVFTFLVATFVQYVLWGYDLPGSFVDRSQCDSAARIGEVMIVGCQKGVWRGRVSDLELAVACTALEDQPNRVRVWDRRSFIASTPCGLYRLGVDGSVVRQPHPPDPGALDADGRGRAVVASGKDLWLLEPEGKRRLEYALAEAPGKLEIRGDWLLVEGRRKWLLGLYEFHQEEVSEWSLHSLPARDRLPPVGRAVPAEPGVPGECEVPDMADLYAAALRAQDFVLPEEPSRLFGWLPEIRVSAFGRQTRKIRWHQEGAWDFSAGRYAGVFVMLTWHLGRMEDTGEDLRARIERERMRLRDRLAVLRAAFMEHCMRNDQQALLEIRTRIDLLTSGAAW